MGYCRGGLCENIEASQVRKQPDPAGSKMHLLQDKAEPVNNASCATVGTYLRKTTAQQQLG